MSLTIFLFLFSYCNFVWFSTSIVWLLSLYETFSWASRRRLGSDSSSNFTEFYSVVFVHHLEKMVDGFLRHPASVLLWHFYLELLIPSSCLSLSCSILFPFLVFCLKYKVYLGREPQVSVSRVLRDETAPGVHRPHCGPFALTHYCSSFSFCSQIVSHCFPEYLLVILCFYSQVPWTLHCFFLLSFTWTLIENKSVCDCWWFVSVLCSLGFVGKICEVVLL